MLAAVLALVLPAHFTGAARAAPVDPRIARRFVGLTRATAWRPVAEIKIGFRTFHPQGMVKIGDDFYVSSVEVLQAPKKLVTPKDGHDRDPGEGVGHLFKIGADGRLLADLVLGEGSIYHPGGIDFDGRFIWVPTSEYRPNSRSIVYKVDPQTMKATEAFRFDDHLGAVAYDRRARRLHAMSWGSRRAYTWPVGFPGAGSKGASRPVRPANPDQFIDFQDCHYVAEERMLCSGLADYAGPDGGRFELGGLDLIDLTSGLPLWQVPVELKSPLGRPMTQNPAFFEATPAGLRAYFMPDDDSSTLFVFDVALP